MVVKLVSEVTSSPQVIKEKQEDILKIFKWCFHDIKLK